LGRPGVAMASIAAMLRDGHVEAARRSLGVDWDALPSALGLAADIDADNARARQAKRRTDDQSALRASTAAAVNNGRWLETERV